MPLIVLEGLDASGKTTQTRLLVQRLTSEYPTEKVFTLDFPQYKTNVFGKILDDFLHNKLTTNDASKFDARLSSLLFAGDRLESKPLLDYWLQDQHAIVVLNRYIGSNIAYNRAKSNDPDAIQHFIETLEYSLLELPKPDLVIVIGSSSEITQKRLRSKVDSYESNTKLLDSVVQEYQYLCNTKPNWIMLEIDGTESPEQLHEQVWSIYLQQLKNLH